MFNMQWSNQWPPNNSQWRHHGRPCPPFRGQQYPRFNQHRPPFQPGSDNYWCETCDRGFATADILSKHTQQHQKCNIDGCQFIAHPNVITKHIQMQHSSGLYKKIANLKNPEEIEKWREERKKRYPTKANIDKKAAELKEKINRGEKMGLERNRNYQNRDCPRYNKDKNSGQGLKGRYNMRNENHPRSKFNRNAFNDNNQNKKPPPKAILNTIAPIQDNRKLKPFAGILNIQMDIDNEVEDSLELNDPIQIEEDDLEYNSVDVKPVDIVEPVVCGALSSLMCMYGSSDEEDNKETANNSTELKNIKLSINDRKMCEDINITKDTKSNQYVIVADISNNLKETQQCTKDVENYAIDVENNKSINTTPAPENDATKNKLENNPHTVNMNLSDCLDLDKGNKDLCITKEGDKVHIQNNDSDDDSGPEEVKGIKNECVAPALPEEYKPKNAVVRKRIVTEKKPIIRRTRPKLPSTLLQKLLLKEMQHERNIILQCIRYIKRNNYFDKKE